MGNKITNISGDMTGRTSVGGSVQKSSIAGAIRTAAKSVKELRFEESLDDFPSVGLDTVLYVANDTNKLYRWNGNAYMEVSEATDVIDDLDVDIEKTWSSQKLDEEFAEDRQSIDNIGNISPLTNLEIEEILNS